MAHRKLYDEIYKVNPENVPWGYEYPDSDLVYIIERLRFPSNARLLDAGCGNGKNTIYLREKGSEIYGFDISDTAVAVAKERVPSGHFVVADAKNLPYVDDCFDIIVDVGLLHCIPPDGWERLKNEFFRILRPKGYYFLRVFSRPRDYPPEKPLFYENVDQTGRTFYERDPSREQIPTWSFNFTQIRAIFREFRTESEFYSGNRIIVIMSKEGKETEAKPRLNRLAESIASLLRPRKQNR